MTSLIWLPILEYLLLASLPIIWLRIYSNKLVTASNLQRKAILRELGVPEPEKRTLVGFFHPYWYVFFFCSYISRRTSESKTNLILRRCTPVPCIHVPLTCSNAGGGGERVLWTEVARLQRTDPQIISVVYSGDVTAGKDKIIELVKVGVLISIL